MYSSSNLRNIKAMGNVTEQKKKERLQKQYYCIPLNHPQLEVFIYVMLFDSMSDLKSFLQDRTVICLLAVLLEEFCFFKLLVKRQYYSG